MHEQSLLPILVYPRGRLAELSLSESIKVVTNTFLVGLYEF
jgi:hypothetical protein